ncbi:glycerophosphodiester phosphodiesterase [Oceanobacillus senegalensis]|uniref:glycerophosphodiester phosphodiesterase n=1 Tax=Oceanobacillus senegalensis TaxID=1936063 RepID=UPI000A30B22F|nr:glycerophosphodiester phosphodiesterase family protein [Oceanobacillus senegalensis]
MKIRGIAHRGYSAKYPENTISAFQAAIDLGFTHMELDVHLSKDGIPVVMHDALIDRMTNGVGEIRDLTLKELKQFAIHPNEKIPSLEEVLHIAKDTIIVSIELKNTDLYDNLEEKVYEVIQRMDMMDQVYIISFHFKALAKLRSMSSEVKIGPLVNKVRRSHFRLLKDLDAKYFAIRHTAIKEKHVKKCEELGVQVIAWTVNEVDQMERMTMQFPSVLITTDELERFQAKKCLMEDSFEQVGI